jgi:serine phosphatase RsbU (regulator of sigma subunit)
MDIRFYKEQLQAKEDMLARTTKFFIDAQTALEIKNKEIANINKSILDSINVAKRIQGSLLADTDLLKTAFKDAAYRVIQQIGIGGDNVFIKKNSEGIVFGLLDTTGHGIPAAMLNISCTLLLRELTISNSIDSPKNLLHLLDYHLNDIFDNATFSAAQAEGCIFSYLPDRKKLTYSAAKGKAMLLNKAGIVEELPYTRKAIGSRRNLPFEDFELYLEDIDKILVYSDGLIDQFGGEENKRFSRTRLKDVFQAHSQHTATEIVTIIEQEFLNWKSTTKQTDDVSFFIIEF